MVTTFPSWNLQNRREHRRTASVTWYDEKRPDYHFDVSCQGSVPEAIIAFLESKDYEDAVRKGISLGGDSDTIACIAGGIAQAFYKEIPTEIISNTIKRLSEEFLTVIDEFNLKFVPFA